MGLKERISLKFAILYIMIFYNVVVYPQMHFLVLAIFWIVLVIILNANIFFPLVLAVAGKYAPKKKISGHHQPPVTVIVAAYNEEKVIAQRIENILAQNYDRSKLEIFIGSDASSDGTNEIIRSYANKYSNVRAFIFDRRRGKSFQLNDMVPQASHQIIVFSDANTVFQSDAIQKMVQHFEDNQVGGVCGQLVLTNNNEESDKGVKEKLYWSIETFLKTNEGKFGMVMGANGGIYAIRKELFMPIHTNPPAGDDISTGLQVIRQGFKLIYEADAIGIEVVGKNTMAEYRRKTRIAALGFGVILYFHSLLFNKNLFLSYLFWSHRVTRWFLSHLLIVLFVTSFILSFDNTLIRHFTLLQITFYLFAFIGYLLSKFDINISIFSTPFYFVLMNVAFFKGFNQFLKKKYSLAWEATERLT